MSAPNKVIVSGVSGQDGSYMVDHLLATTDHLVYGMVRRTAKPDYSNLTEAVKNPRFTFVTGDLSDTTSIDALVKQISPDYFINLGGQSFVGSSWQIPEMTLDVNAGGVLRCLEAIRKHAPQCRFYSAGTSEELGKVEYSPQDEKHPLRPQSPYGAAKCAARHLVRVYRESYGLYAVHSTLFNHESPRRGVEFVTRKITLGVAKIAAALKARPVGWSPSILDGKRLGPHHAVSGCGFDPIQLGNLDARRDWSHARDFVEGIWMMLNQEKPQEYVLASGETHSIREFIELAFKAADIDTPSDRRFCFWDGLSGQPETQGYYYRNTNCEYWPAAEAMVVVNPAFYRPAEVTLLHGDASLARTELGWSPKVSFSQLVTEMVVSDLRAVNL